MIVGYAEGYMAKFYGELEVNARTDRDGQPIETKTVLFSIGSRQTFQSDRVVNGTTQRDYQSDFPLFRANGVLAQTIWDNLHLIDPQQQKLISRHVLIEFEEITYNKDRAVTAANNIEVNGQIYKVEFPITVPQTNTIHLVRRIFFLDSNPLRKNDATANAQTQAMPVVTPVMPTAQAVPATPAMGATSAPAPANQGVAAPFANAAIPAANNTGAVYAQAGVATPVAAPQPFQGMNVPEDCYMDPNFANPGFDTNYASGLPTPEVGFGMPQGFDPNGSSAPC